MKIETIQKLCCPFDKSELELTTITKDLQENIIEGYLYCGDCERIYPIVSGIPIMSPDEYREFKIEKPLIAHLTNAKLTKDFRLIKGEPQHKTIN